MLESVQYIQTSVFDQSLHSESSIIHISSHPGFIKDMYNANMKLNKDHRRGGTSQPIKDPETLELVKLYLLESSPKFGKRNWLIFMIGNSIGRRCGDILALRIADVWDEDSQSLREEIKITEEKTGKEVCIPLCGDLAVAMREYILSLPSREGYLPLLPSNKHGERKPKGERKRVAVQKNTEGCLSTSSYWRILNQIGKDLGIQGLGTHTMRKNFGYHYIKATAGQLINGEYNPIDVLGISYGHSDRRQTLKYIGVEKEVLRSLYEQVQL